MREKEIDPPCDIWEELRQDCDWIDDLYEEWSEREDIALHNYECSIYNELDRRILA